MNPWLIVIPLFGFIFYYLGYNKIFFFGTVFHEIGHYFFLKLLRVKVYEVDWLSHVEHEKLNELWKQFFVSFGPFIFNFAIAILIFYLAIDSGWNLLSIFFGTGLVLNSVPSKQDFKVLLETFFGLFLGRGCFLDYLTIALLAAIFVLVSVGFFAFDAFYLLGISVLILVFIVLAISTFFGEILNIILFILIIKFISGDLFFWELIWFFEQPIDIYLMWFRGLFG